MIPPGGGSAMVPENAIHDECVDRVAALIQAASGIRLSLAKRRRLADLLAVRLPGLGRRGCVAYCDYLRNRADELDRLVAQMTTNVTCFMREEDHFECLREVVWPDLRRRAARRGYRIRAWSAGCSTGEEPYSMAMILADCLEREGGGEPWTLEVLATDLNPDVLRAAREGIFTEERVRRVPPDLLRRFFQRGTGARTGLYRVTEQLRQVVTFARLNLMADRYPAREGFDIIFCRNVAIYFGAQDRLALWKRLAACLAGGGYLFSGHTDGFMGLPWLRRLSPTVYRLADEA